MKDLEDIVSKLSNFFHGRKIDVDSEADTIIHDNYCIRQSIVEDPSRKEELRKIYSNCYEEYKPLHKGAEMIDKADRVLGVVQSLLQLANANSAFYLTKVAEVGAKLGFSIYYFSKTDDFKSCIGFGMNEALGTLVKYGSLVNIYNLYENSVKGFIRQKASEKYTDFLFNQTVGRKDFQYEPEILQTNRNSFKI